MKKVIKGSKQIAIGRKAYDQIMYYVHKCKFEISGLGNVRIINGIPTVTDIFLIEQENHSTETEMNPNAIGKCIYEHHKSGMEGDLKFWWHSHVNMSVHWSGPDMDTITELTKHGWFIHGVFNKKNEHKLAYSNNEPFETFIDDVELLIDEDMIDADIFDLYHQIDQLQDKINKDCDEKFDELVTYKPYVHTYAGTYNYGGNKTLQELKDKFIKKDTTIINFNEIKAQDQTWENKFWVPTGAKELKAYGFSDEDILYTQDTLQIYDLDDMAAFEITYGSITNFLNHEDDELDIESTFL